MAYELPPTNITNGTNPLVDLIAYESGQIPILAPAILFLIFMVIFGSGYLAEDRKKGRANVFKWYAISSFITATLGIILFLMDGIVGLTVISILVVNSLVATLLLFFAND